MVNRDGLREHRVSNPLQRDVGWAGYQVKRFQMKVIDRERKETVTLGFIFECSNVAVVNA